VRPVTFEERNEIRDRYGLSEKQARERLTPEVIKQLRRCADEEARRIILQVSR
jgi:hypothetical protein